MPDRDDIPTIAARIRPIFGLFGWTWHDTNGVPPDEDRIAENLRSKMADFLESSSTTSVFSGRILIEKDDDYEHYEVYVHVGSL